MDFLRKLTVLLVIILFSFIFYRLMKQRQLIITNIANSKKEREGFMSEDDPLYGKITDEIKKVSITSEQLESRNVCKSLVNNTSLPIMQFCIKGSMNSAFSGKYISSEMVNYVLSRGCRFLDFQVFYLPSDDRGDSYDAYVGFSKNITSYNSIDSKNTMKWIDMLKDTIDSAFATFTSKQYKTTNINDPLFIQIRMNTDDPSKLYKMIQDSISTVISNYNNPDIIYNKSVNRTTVINNILSKVIFVFDYEPKTGKGKYHHMTSNTQDIMRTFYSQINPSKYKANPPKQLTITTTNTYSFNILQPDDNQSSITSNPNIFSSIKNYGIQVNMMQYYINDMNLLKCENMFQSYSGAIIPMTNALSYIDNYGDDTSDNIIFPQLFSNS